MIEREIIIRNETTARNFQEGFLSLPLSNLPCPELSLNMPCRPSLKYCGISETTENHAQDKELHSAVYQFLFLRFLVSSYIKYTMIQAKRQGEAKLTNNNSVSSVVNKKGESNG